MTGLKPWCDSRFRVPQCIVYAPVINLGGPNSKDLPITQNGEFENGLPYMETLGDWLVSLPKSCPDGYSRCRCSPDHQSQRVRHAMNIRYGSLDLILSIIYIWKLLLASEIKYNLRLPSLEL